MGLVTPEGNESFVRPIWLHDLRHSTATLPLEQGVELIAIEELFGHSHIGVTAGVYAYLRLRIQRDAIDLLRHALRKPTEANSQPKGSDGPPLRAAPVH